MSGGGDNPITVKQVAALQQTHFEIFSSELDTLRTQIVDAAAPKNVSDLFIANQFASVAETLDGMCKFMGMDSGVESGPPFTTPSLDPNCSNSNQFGALLNHFSGRHPGDSFHSPKIEFPRFDGTNPRAWVRKCERYFQLKNIDVFKRVDIASIHFDGKADDWFLDYQEGKNFIE